MNAINYLYMYIVRMCGDLYVGWFVDFAFMRRRNQEREKNNNNNTEMLIEQSDRTNQL